MGMDVLRFLELIPAEGILAANLMRRLNEGVPRWKFWRRWRYCQVYVALLRLEDRNLVESQWKFFPNKRRFWVKTHAGILKTLGHEWRQAYVRRNGRVA